MDDGWISASEEELTRSWAINILLSLDDHRDLGPFFATDRIELCQSPGVLRDQSQVLETKDQCTIRAALYIWSGSGHLYLFEMLEQWESEEWARFIKAICVVKGIHSSDLVDTHLNQTVDLMELF